MAMSDSSFDLILQELLHQQTCMESLEAENLELRQQIANLRAGQGIFVEILGHRFALHSESTAIPSYMISSTVSSVTQAPTVEIPTVTEVPTTPQIVEEPQPTLSLVALEPASPFEEESVETPETAAAVPSTPFPVMDFLMEDDGPLSSSSFFEEMQQTDEIAFENTNKLAIWGEPVDTPTHVPASAGKQEGKQPSSARIGEDEKATLRRELIGSFLLE